MESDCISTGKFGKVLMRWSLRSSFQQRWKVSCKWKRMNCLHWGVFSPYSVYSISETFRRADLEYDIVRRHKQIEIIIRYSANQSLRIWISDRLCAVFESAWLERKANFRRPTKKPKQLPSRLPRTTGNPVNGVQRPVWQPTKFY